MWPGARVSTSRRLTRFVNANAALFFSAPDGRGLRRVPEERRDGSARQGERRWRLPVRVRLLLLRCAACSVASSRRRGLDPTRSRGGGRIAS